MIRIVATRPQAVPGARRRPADRTFEQEAVAVASRLRAEVTALIGALPDRVSGATDLNRQLKLGSTVSWRLYTFATAASPIAGLEHLPGRATITRLAAAARKKGLPKVLTDRVLESYDKFEAFMQEHAGDRATLASLVEGVAITSGAASQNTRRNAFRQNSSLWGVLAKARIACAIIHENPQSGEDLTLVAGYVHVQSLRRGVDLQLTQRASASDTNESQTPVRTHMVPFTEIEVLADFCSKPLPEITTSIDHTGRVRVTRVHSLDVGKAGAMSFFTAERANQITDGSPQVRWWTGWLVRIPVETLISDLLVPRGRSDPATVGVQTYGNLWSMEEAYERRKDDLLPIRETAAYLGTDLDALRSPEMPNYPEMVRQVLRKQGWDRDAFDIYRCRVQYPILHTLVDLRVEASTR